MAQMFPENIPNYIRRDPRRSAEIKVYEALKSTLGDEWIVLYSKPWWGLDAKGGEIDGECDFIIAHAEYGVMFIEVKGGRIKYDPKAERWTTTDRNNLVMRINDPFQQAIKSKYQVLEKLKKFNLMWPKSHVVMKHGVIFPDTLPPSGGYVGPYEAELCAFSGNVKSSLGGWIEKRMSNIPEGQSGPGSNGVKALRLLYANPAELRESLSSKIEEFDGQTSILLTGSQMHVLLELAENSRSVIRGGAGTGKTLLAQEHASRMAESGESVLVLCNNPVLHASMVGKLSNNPLIDIHLFEDLFDMQNQKNTSTKNWNVVILDEAQDVDYFWWPPIETLIKPTGSLVALFDSNQSIYHPTWDIVSELGAKEYLLRLNLRNSKEIGDATKTLYLGPPIDSVGPSGEKPSWIEATRKSAPAEIVSKTRELIEDEGLLPGQLAILTADDLEVKELRMMLKEAGFGSASASNYNSKSVRVDTVANFKGLESPVVIILSNPEIGRDVKLSYVSISRAKLGLFVVGPRDGDAYLSRAI